MSKTKIEWAEYGLPLATGCSHAGTPGCDHCYAARLAATRLKHNPRYKGLASKVEGGYRWSGEIRLHPDKLLEPLHRRKPTMYFVCHTSDLFHEAVPDEFIERVWMEMAWAPQHVFLVLTKRPTRMEEFLSRPNMRAWPDGYLNPVEDPFLGQGTLPNVWAGTSVENQAAADERIPHLLRTPAAKRFVSCEPLLGRVDLTEVHAPADSLLDWVIAGGESGPGARPMHPDWARSLRDQCQAADVPFFFKAWGEYVTPAQMPASMYRATEVGGTGHAPVRVGKKAAGRLLDGREWNEMPERKEAP